MSAAKKPAITRVYQIIGADGKTRYVEAPNLAQAIQHVYAPVTGRPLSGARVAELMRENPTIIEVAGVMPA
jgi:hypothetical protein